MCSPKFGFYPKAFHSEQFCYDHACGNVFPGDVFVSDVSRVTCKECLARICPTPCDIEDVDLCDCGEPFPESGSCRFCGAHARYNQ